MRDSSSGKCGLRLKKSREYGRGYTFNFEEGGENDLPGNRTAAKLAAILGDGWRDLGAARQKDLVDEIVSFESEEPLVGRLVKGWGFEPAAARQVAETPLEPGYGSLSRKAMRKLLPLMREGERFATARKKIYPESLQAAEPVDVIPPKHRCSVLRNLRNPAVARALSELRKIVSALIRRYGKPESIRIELARDLKHARKRRQEMADQNLENRKSRDAASKRIFTEMHDERYCTPGNILKVRLADECNWECPYTGRSISMEALVGDYPQFDIEHIIPFSRSLDNSFLNKTLCYHEENRNVKQGQTPFHAYGKTDRWDEIIARVKRFRGDARARRRKLELFQTETLPDPEDFSNRQLNDTRYMARLAGDYLGLLYGGQIDATGTRRIRVSPGRVTSFLRRQWGLNAILGDPEEKDRDDHRHHAIDALVVALTDANHVSQLSRAAEQAEELGGNRLFVPINPPSEDFVADARRAVEAINVSYRASRKLSGKLHKETILSHPKPVVDAAGKRTQCHHVRKQLEKLSVNEVEKIVDDRIRNIVQEHLHKNGGDLKKAFADANNHPYHRTRDGRIIPIHKVRLRSGDNPILVGKGTKQRYVNSGSNHHMEIVAVLDEDGREIRWEAHIVSCDGPGLADSGRRRNNAPERSS